MTPAAGLAGAASADVPIRPAATVVLMRDGADGIETWLLRRVRQMVFAAGMTVFPGGRVEAGDAAASVPWLGAEPADVAARFGCSVSHARAAVVAAVRETFEETGVLLTNPAFSGASSELVEIRHAVEGGATPFADVLVERSLRVDAEHIRPWARWVTPPGESRRFDAYFYVAALPGGAQALDDCGEAASAGWVRPADAVAEWRRGERPMLPPTSTTLQELSRFTTVAEVLRASSERSLHAVRLRRPRMDLSGPGATAFPGPG